MAINFDSFTEGTTSTIQSNDYVVGFDTAVPGGERKWTVSTLANAVSGLIQQEILNKAMTTLGNYPYLEYGWVTAPNAAGQSITANTITTLTIDTEVADTGNFGSISSNQITLSAGTYQFEASTSARVGYQANPGGSSSILALYNVSDSAYVTRGILGETDAMEAGGHFLARMGGRIKGQFKITSIKTFDLRILGPRSMAVDNGHSSLSLSTNSTAGADQRTTIKLWKVG